MPGLQIRYHRGQVRDVSIFGVNRVAPPHASVRDGGSGVPTRGHRRGRARPQPPLLAVAALAISAVGEDQYKVVGSAHASTGASWQRRGTSWAPRVMSPEARARCVAT